MTVEEWVGKDNTLGIDIWHKKYQHNNETFDEFLDRVSGGDPEVRDLIKSRKFVFGGRILSNRGLQNEGRKLTYSNCYVIEPPEDNLEDIWRASYEAAKTYAYGGGCGIDISKLSPRGAAIHNAAKTTSGAVSFADLYNATTGLIGQNVDELCGMVCLVIRNIGSMIGSKCRLQVRNTSQPVMKHLTYRRTRKLVSLDGQGICVIIHSCLESYVRLIVSTSHICCIHVDILNTRNSGIAVFQNMSGTAQTGII